MSLAASIWAALLLAAPAAHAQATDAPATLAPSTAAPPDRVSVLLPVDAGALLDGGGSEGRLLLFLRRVDSRARGAPADAPFFDDPQPMYGRDVARLEAGTPIPLDAETIGFPAPIDALSGRFEAQAVFDRSRTERGALAPGNLVSEVTEIDLDAGRADAIALTFSRRVPPVEASPEEEGIIWEEMPSAMLSRAIGPGAVMRAGVVLPRGYHDIRWPRREWPVIYVIPGFGGRHTMARQYARLAGADRAHLVAPQAIWVVLDPETPLGHHLFADSEIHGPRAKALVEEFIPWLESRYRIIAKPEARLLTGHSSGGWSALWLQLEHPETFGACFASAPDPVDFSAFQATDLYHDESLFVDADGAPTPSYRRMIGPEYERVLMTAAQEAAMERVLSPRGDSGQQWDAWGAVFGRVDRAALRARPMFDADTGRIDRAVVEEDWARYDIARRIDREWATLGPIVTERVRLLCGDRDDFYLDRAVAKLRALVERRRAAEGDATKDETHRGAADGVDAPGASSAGAPGASSAVAPGYIELVPGATHGSLPSTALLRWHVEMKAHLKRHGLD